MGRNLKAEQQGRENRARVLAMLKSHPSWGAGRISKALRIGRSTATRWLRDIYREYPQYKKERGRWHSTEHNPGAVEQRQAARIAELEQVVKDLQRDKADVLGQLEQARGARKPVPATPAKPRPRKKADVLRVFAGDLHGMKGHQPAVDAFLGDLKVLDPDEVILNGDIVDCGGFLAQHHTLGYVAENDYSYEEDVAAAGAFLDAVAKAAPRARIEMLEGNHEARVERWANTQALKHQRDADMLRRMVSPETLLKLKSRGIPYYRRAEKHGDCRIPGWVRKGKTFVVHEISSAKHAAAAAVASTAGNVIYAHTHRGDYSTLNLPGVGLVAAWNPGCLCELQPLWRHTRPTDWTHGHLVQFEAAGTGDFLNVLVPITDGKSLLSPMMQAG